MSDSPIFIVGCPRSGTNLLRDLLRSHPHLAFPDESHFIPEFYSGYGDPKNEHEARSLAARILNLHWVQAWRLELDLSLFANDRSYRRMFLESTRSGHANRTKLDGEIRRRTT
jgi:hypothetical protein